jgi:Flp pilus assembly pilin Flp
LNRKSIPYFTAIIGLLWLFFIIAGYEITHLEFDSSIINNFWIFLVVFTFVCLAGGIGNRIWRKTEEIPLLSVGVLQVLIGFGLVSVVILALGALWRINATLIAIVMALGIIACARNIFAWLKSVLTGITAAFKHLSAFEILLLAYLCAIFLIQLVQSFAPPIKYDALIYHLTLPKIYLQQQKISDIPWLVMSGMPQTTEMLYMTVMAMAGETAPLVLNWFFGILTALGLFGFAADRLNSKSALIGVVSLFAGYTVVSALSWGYVDWAGCLFGLGMLVSLVVGQQHKSTTLFFLSGLFAGLAFSSKYTAGVLFLCGFIALSIYTWKEKLNYLRNIWQYCLGAGLMALPWLVKNWVFTGNPIYPFFIESGAMTATRIGVYQGATPYGDLLDLFLLPIRATIQGIDGSNGYSVSLGPLFLGLSLLAFLAWEKIDKTRKTEIFTIGLLCLSGLVIWSVGNQISGYLIQTRFYFSLFPAFAVMSAYGFENLENNALPKKGLLVFVRVLVVFVLFVNSYQITRDFAQKRTLSFFFGLETRQEYLESNLGWYARVTKEIQELPQGSHVLFLYEPRGFECVSLCDPDEILDHWKVAYSEQGTPDLILSNWKSDGYTHLLIYNQGIEFLKENYDPHHTLQELTALESFLNTVSLEKDYGGTYSLYRLED